MTPQQIFDTVATHLFTQGKQAVNTNGACMYRGENGTKCAIGVLIPDNLYTDAMEGRSAGSLFHVDVDYPQYLEVNKKLLSSLQNVHDFSYNWDNTETLKDALVGVAEMNQLSTDVLEGLSLPNEQTTS